MHSSAHSTMERLERRPPTGFDHVVTVGDSTLDNLIWMEKDGGGAFRKRDCVVGALRRVLGKTRDSLVTNLAADGAEQDLERYLPRSSHES